MRNNSRSSEHQNSPMPHYNAHTATGSPIFPSLTLIPDRTRFRSDWLVLLVIPNGISTRFLRDRPVYRVRSIRRRSIDRSGMSKMHRSKRWPRACRSKVQPRASDKNCAFQLSSRPWSLLWFGFLDFSRPSVFSVSRDVIKDEIGTNQVQGCSCSEKWYTSMENYRIQWWVNGWPPVTWPK